MCLYGQVTPWKNIFVRYIVECAYVTVGVQTYMKERYAVIPYASERHSCEDCRVSCLFDIKSFDRNDERVMCLNVCMHVFELVSVERSVAPVWLSGRASVL